LSLFFLNPKLSKYGNDNKIPYKITALKINHISFDGKIIQQIIVIRITLV